MNSSHLNSRSISLSTAQDAFDKSRVRHDGQATSKIIPIEGFSPVGGATLRLVPSMSEHFHRLAQNLSTISSDHPDDISLPAGVVVIAAAGLEAYANELAEIGVPDERRGAFTQLDTNLVAKLEWLRDNPEPGGHPNNPAALSDEILADAKLLYGFRGALMHYKPQPEHPVDTRTSLQRLLNRFPPESVREAAPPPSDQAAGFVAFANTSLSRLLTPELASWAVDVLEATIRATYQAGWEVPRPLWIPFVDPTRE